MNDDHALKNRCLRGEEDAWREFYKGVFILARSVALYAPFRFDEETAADIGQDTVIEITRKLATAKNWGAFARRIAHNKCVDRVRKKKETPLTSFARNGEEVERLLDNLTAPEYLPETLDDSRALALLRATLDGLGQPCASLLRHRFLDEMSYDNVAIQNSIPANQVGVYISRCLGRLRRAIQGHPRMWDELKELLRTGAMAGT